MFERKIFNALGFITKLAYDISGAIAIARQNARSRLHKALKARHAGTLDLIASIQATTANVVADLEADAKRIADEIEDHERFLPWH